ncbi:MAG TPA: hypothetical protein VJT11_05730 [Nitrospiraceae bacterium]|nr:hypothetical protein [Nitrospiraceae bacterium]
MTVHNIISQVPTHLKVRAEELRELVESFVGQCQPLEQGGLYVLADRCTEALFCECHINASTLLKYGTVDVPLDPEEQTEYRANREVVEDHVAFERMKSDALNGRAFSNLVVEFRQPKDEEPSLMVIGGQHRFHAIESALEKGVDEYHGIKVYFGLSTDQRLDVQLISNTNIAVSSDLLDRMYETWAGPELRTWCQDVGLLYEGQDFADKRQRGQPITVRAARTFIMNYLAGKEIDPEKFDQLVTTPIIAKTGAEDPEWEILKEKNPKMWDDPAMKAAGLEFSALAKAQRNFYTDPDTERRTNIDFAEKASNYAVLSAWAYTAGILSRNQVRLQRHFSLRETKGKDPLNASALARGRHRTDAENYRGLGYRTDPKERARLVELFFLQADKGEGISKPLIQLAIAKYQAKQALSEVWEAEAKT